MEPGTHGVIDLKNTLVSGNADDEKNIHPGGRKLLLLSLLLLLLLLSSLLLLLLIIILRALLLVAPADSVRADNNLLSKVSQSLAQ